MYQHLKQNVWKQNYSTKVVILYRILIVSSLIIALFVKIKKVRGARKGLSKTNFYYSPS